MAHAADPTDDGQDPNTTITVTGQRADRYRAGDTTALGVDLSLKETPATVNVVTAEFLKDTAAKRLSDIIAYIPGIVNNEKSTSVTEYFIVRGFSTSGTYLNGVRQFNGDLRRGIATIDRVEILKGPAGGEVGVADPGGTVNVITKQPQSTFAASLEGSIGDFNYRNLTADITGPIALDGRLQARLVGGYQQSASWRPALRDHMPFITAAPSLKLDYMEGSSIYVQYEYNNSKEYYDRGVLHLEGYYPGGFGPRDTSAIGYDGNYSKTISHRYEAGVDQKIGPFTATLRYQRFDARNTLLELAAEPQSGDIYVVPDPDASPDQIARDSYTWNGTGFTIPYFLALSPDWRSGSENISGSLKAEFSVLGVRNTMVGGYDRTSNRYDGANPGPTVSNVLDIRNPRYDQPPMIVDGPVAVFNQSGREKIKSYYVKWVARPSDRFRLLAAGRWDSYRQRFSYTYDDGAGYFESGDSTLTDKLFSYRAAGSFDVTRAVTAFVGYSNGYLPQSGQSRTGPVPALRARSLEAGVKLSFADGKALWTNTIYSIRQDNLTIEDPTNVPPLESFVILFGAVRARGFESELTGKVLPGLDLSAGVSVLQSKVVENGSGLQGNRTLNVPAFQASAFASYNFEHLGLKPLTARLGVSGLGNRQGNPENTFKLPGYVRVDAGASYAFNNRFEVGVAVENLLDRTYYVAADQGGLGGGTVSVGNRRLVQANLGVRF